MPELRFALLCLLIAIVGSALAVSGATLNASPANITSVLNAAQGGDLIVLGRNNYTNVKLTNKAYNPALTINGDFSTVYVLSLTNVSNLVYSGGIISGTSLDTYFAVSTRNSNNVSFNNVRFTLATAGASFSESTSVSVTNSWFTGLRSDGADFAACHNVVLVGNICDNFQPIPATYYPNGTLLQDGNHPDCFQFWSLKGKTPTSDVLITNNTAIGTMQGISFFNPDDGGADRVVIEDNIVQITFWQGIALYNGRDSKIRHNYVKSLPGSVALNYPFKKISSNINVVGGSGNIACGNVVPDVPGSPTTVLC